MRKLTIALLAVLLLLAVAAPSEAWHWGYPYSWWSPFHPLDYPWWAFVPPQPQVIITQPAVPQTYIQREPEQPQQYYWYWCQNPAGFYPYVQQCSVSWLQVVPQTTPPGQR